MSNTLSDLAMLSAASLVVSSSAMTGAVVVQKIADSIEPSTSVCTKASSVLPSTVPDYKPFDPK